MVVLIIITVLKNTLIHESHLTDQVRRENERFQQMKIDAYMKIVAEDKKRDAEYIAKLDAEEKRRADELANTYATQEKRMNLQLFATKDVRLQAKLDGERALREQAAKVKANIAYDKAQAEKRRLFNLECKETNDAMQRYNHDLRWKTFYENQKIAAANKAVADANNAELDMRRAKAKADALKYQAAVVKQRKSDRRARMKVEMSSLDRQLHATVLRKAQRWKQSQPAKARKSLMDP